MDTYSQIVKEWRKHWETKKPSNDKEWEESNGPAIADWWLDRLYQDRQNLKKAIEGMRIGRYELDPKRNHDTIIRNRGYNRAIKDILALLD